MTPHSPILSYGSEHQAGPGRLGRVAFYTAVFSAGLFVIASMRAFRIYAADPERDTYGILQSVLQSHGGIVMVSAGMLVVAFALLAVGLAIASLVRGFSFLGSVALAIALLTFLSAVFVALT